MEKISLGLMSGTSMDGIDVALIATDGEKQIRSLAKTALSYPDSLRILLKASASTANVLGGKTTSIIHYEHYLLEYLHQEVGLAHADKMLKALRAEYAQGSTFTFEDIVSLSTRWHEKAARQLLATLPVGTRIDVMGYHGQTLYHQPEHKTTLQIGDGEYLARTFNIPVVYRFRENDIEHGGQGAPFAPIYHQALCMRDGLYPAVIVNCGGIANVSWILGQKIYEVLGYDTGPGNTLLDRFIQRKTEGKETYDRDGHYALQGRVHTDVMDALLTKSCLKKDYFKQPPPKSLCASDFVLIDEVLSLPITDGAATLASFTAKMIVESLQWITIPCPKQWILAGGGWHHPFMVSELKRYLHHTISSEIMVRHAHEVGWDDDALEAELFAYLAVRRLYNLPASMPRVTGVRRPMIGGVIAQG